MDEVWMDIKGYEGYYQVSNMGRVRSLDRLNSLGRKIQGRVLVTCYNKKRNNTCEKVKLSKDGSYKYHYVSRLVWLTFNNKELNEEIYIYHDKENKNNEMNNLQSTNSKKKLELKQ